MGFLPQLRREDERRCGMKVYIVITDDGTIYSVRRNKKSAEADKVRLESLYERFPTIKECIVH